MLFLMLTFLMIQLQSFSRLFLVLSVAPLGLIGVVAALLRLRQAARLRRHSRRAGADRHDRAQFGHPDRPDRDREGARARALGTPSIEATSHRFRPILLTAAAAILGMIPIAPTVFWGPMAFAIMGGLAGRDVLTLIFLPALYVAWFRVKEPAAAN